MIYNSKKVPPKRKGNTAERSLYAVGGSTKINMHYIIVNETHLKGKNLKKLDTVKAVFERAGIKYEVLPTTHKGHAAEYARSITSGDGENTVIAMGGDGTLHEILNGFENFEKNYLGLIPFGTGNDFAAVAGVPLDVKEAAEIIVFRAPTYIDYIQLSTGLRSINAVGMGIDVEVLERTYSGKRHGKSKYFRSLIASMFKYKSCNFTVEYDGKVERHFGLIAALGNGRQFGGGIKMFPEAVIDDGYMDMIIVDYISRPKLIAALLKLVRGKINTVKGATVARVKTAKFIMENPDFTIQAEGELYKNVPIDAEIVTGKLKFYL